MYSISAVGLINMTKGDLKKDDFVVTDQFGNSTKFPTALWKNNTVMLLFAVGSTTFTIRHPDRTQGETANSVRGINVQYSSDTAAFTRTLLNLVNTGQSSRYKVH
jgi:hypothetical protein